MKKTPLLTCLVLSAAPLGARTNTLDGAGRDISKAGDKIQETF